MVEEKDTIDEIVGGLLECKEEIIKSSSNYQIWEESKGSFDCHVHTKQSWKKVLDITKERISPYTTIFEKKGNISFQASISIRDFLKKSDINISHQNIDKHLQYQLQFTYPSESKFTLKTNFFRFGVAQKLRDLGTIEQNSLFPPTLIKSHLRMLLSLSEDQINERCEGLKKWFKNLIDNIESLTDGQIDYFTQHFGLGLNDHNYLFSIVIDTVNSKRFCPLEPVSKGGKKTTRFQKNKKSKIKSKNSIPQKFSCKRRKSIRKSRRRLQTGKH